MDLHLPYFVLAYYSFHNIEKPKQEVETHREFLSKLSATSRIYISEEGINGQMSAAKEDALKYIDWIRSRPEFKHIEFKVTGWHEQAFPRLTIKYRKHLVARERDVDLANQGEHVPAKQWEEMLENEKDALLLDVRNDYEWKLGRFNNATVPPCETFREFEQYADTIKNTYDPKEKKILMYCTGGIRCEVYSALLKSMGFEKVYQLDGGIIKYGLENGSKHWLGKLFVFDDRLSVPISHENAPVIGKCHHCGNESESYYNCANTDCNELFLCCKTCVTQFKGCCKNGCMEAPRVRPFHEENAHKPFLRQHHYTNT